MVYDCDNWLTWPFCWIWFGQVVTVLYVAAIGAGIAALTYAGWRRTA